MILSNINFLSALVAAAAAWLVSGIYYSVLGKQWMAAQGKTMESCKAEMERKTTAQKYLPFVLAYLGSFIMAVMLFGILTHLNMFSMRGGVISAVLIWIGFIATAITVNNAFQGRSFRLTLIDGFGWLLALIVIGAIVGYWGR